MRGTETSPGEHVRPLIVAHRGARLEAPENTRSAFDIALARGVDGLELDVQLTRDGVPVLYHDRTLSRFGKRNRRISDYSFGELEAFNRGAPLMSLNSTLERYCRMTRLFIEIKSRPYDRAAGRHEMLVRKVAQCLDRLVPPQRLKEMVVLSFDPEVLRLAHCMNPGLKLVQNMTSPSGLDSATRPKGIVISGACVPIRILNASFSRRAHGLGLTVLTYSCNTPQQFRKARGAGADIIMTDDPRRLVDYLQRKDSE